MKKRHNHDPPLMSIEITDKPNDMEERGSA